MELWQKFGDFKLRPLLVLFGMVCLSGCLIAVAIAVVEKIKDHYSASFDREAAAIEKSKVSYFLANPAFLDSVLVECADDPARLAQTAACINANAAIERLRDQGAPADD